MKTRAELYFGKGIQEITENDLQLFIRKGEREGSVLEYKEFSDELWNNNFDKVLKDVCAFANTLGGLLILGISEKDHRPSEIKGSKLDKTKEDLARKIQANIVYQIPGIQVESIECNIDEEQQRVFIIEVPQSSNPPHQVNYKEGIRRYYIRMEHESKEADHCWVEALFQKRLKPEITVDLFLGQNWAENDYQRYGRKIRKYKGEMRITNKGYISAYDVYFVLKLFNAVALTTDDKNICLNNEMEPKSLYNEHYYFHLHPRMTSRHTLFKFDAYIEYPFCFLITASAKDIKPVMFFFKTDGEIGKELTSYSRYSIDHTILMEQTEEFTETHDRIREIDILLNIIKGQKPNQIYNIEGDTIRMLY